MFKSKLQPKVGPAYTEREISEALEEAVKQGLLVKFYDKDGKPTYKDTRYLTQEDLETLKRQKQ